MVIRQRLNRSGREEEWRWRREGGRAGRQMKKEERGNEGEKCRRRVSGRKMRRRETKER